MNTRQAVEILTKIGEKSDLQLVPFVVVTASPLTVYLDSGSTPVPGKRLPEQTLSSGQTGMALFSKSSGVPPLCIRTV